MTTPNWDAIPAPSDDGACNHLLGKPLPSTISLPNTSGQKINLSTLPGLTILFFYPRTAKPNETVPETWNLVPGARGCTPQACSFRDASASFAAKGVRRVYGVSVQGSGDQREVRERLGLGYELLSDSGLEFARAMGLPTFMWEGGEEGFGERGELIKRVTVAVEEGVVVRVWYPVFPPDQSANEVLKWLESR